MRSMAVAMLALGLCPIAAAQEYLDGPTRTAITVADVGFVEEWSVYAQNGHFYLRYEMSGGVAGKGVSISRNVNIDDGCSDIVSGVPLNMIVPYMLRVSACSGGFQCREGRPSLTVQASRYIEINTDHLPDYRNTFINANYEPSGYMCDGDKAVPITSVLPKYTPEVH